MSEQAKQALLSMDSFSISVFRGFGPRWVRRVFLGGARRAFPRAPRSSAGRKPVRAPPLRPFPPNPHQNIKEVILGSAGK